jgi:WD40 repeat protein
VTGSDYNTAKIVAWNGNAWVEQYTIEYDKIVDLIAISADGNRVVTGSNFTAAKITAWNGNAWGQQYTIAYDGPVFSVAISADGNRVVIGSGETAKIVELLPTSSLPGISDFDTYLFEHLLLWAKEKKQKISKAGWSGDIARSIIWRDVEPVAKKELQKLIRETMQHVGAQE